MSNYEHTWNEWDHGTSQHTHRRYFLNKIKNFKLKNTTKKKKMSIDGVEHQNGEDGGKKEGA